MDTVFALGISHGMVPDDALTLTPVGPAREIPHTPAMIRFADDGPVDDNPALLARHVWNNERIPVILPQFVQRATHARHGLDDPVVEKKLPLSRRQRHGHGSFGHGRTAVFR